jgi:hypothetical protein
MSVHISELLPGPGERVGTFGGTRSGKSAYMEWEMRTIQYERPTCMQILVDTKPRFRAEKKRHRIKSNWRQDASGLYKNWHSGPVVPNSVLMDLHSTNPFKGMWPKDNPSEIVIMQSGESEDWRRMLQLLSAFVKAQVKDRERRIAVDEVFDFYGRNTYSIDNKNDVFLRAARAGAERGIGIEFGAHRVRGLPPLILGMMSRVNLFHLRHDADMKYLAEMGIMDAKSPDGKFVFKQWTIQQDGTLSPPFTGRATYPDSYLRQLSKT